MTALSAILNILWMFFKIVGIPIIVIIVLVIIFKTIIECSKYGKNVFSAFKTRNIDNTRDELLHITLDKINWYKKVIKPKFLKSNSILVDGNGVSIFEVFTKVGNFDGTSTSKYLYYRCNGKEYRIDNPVLSLNSDEKIVRKLLPNVKVTKYIVLTEGTYVNNINGITQIHFNKLPYGLPEKKGYTNTEIEVIANKLVSKSV